MERMLSSGEEEEQSIGEGKKDGKDRKGRKEGRKDRTRMGLNE